MADRIRMVQEKQQFLTFLQAFTNRQRYYQTGWTGHHRKSTIEINKAGIARTFQNIRLFKEMTVLDNVKVGLHNHHSYSTLTGILRLPKYHKVEKEMIKSN